MTNQHADTERVECQHYWIEFVWEPGVVKCYLCGQPRYPDGQVRALADALYARGLRHGYADPLGKIDVEEIARWCLEAITQADPGCPGGAIKRWIERAPIDGGSVEA